MPRQTKNTPQRLITWIWHRPVQFSLLFLGTIFGICFAYFGIAQMFFGGANMISPTPLAILLFINTILCIRWLIKKLPNNNLDRTSFISISIAQSLLSLIFITFVTLSTMFMAVYSLSAQIISALIFILFSAYFIAVSLISLYTTYLRMRKMGVSPWKFILSIPFGTQLLWTSGYVIDDKPSTKKTIIQLKPGWFSKIINWATSNTNHILILLFLDLLISITIDVLSATLAILILIPYLIFLAILGTNKMRNAIPKSISTIAIILNIFAIIGCVTLGAISLTQSPITQPTEITIIETAQ